MQRLLGSGERVARRAGLKKVEEEIGLAAGRRSWERAETRKGFEFEREVSCRSHWWWRTQLDFGSAEPFDDLHGASAFRVGPRIGRVLDACGVLFGLRLWSRAEHVKAKRQECGAFAVGQETEVTDVHETLWKEVQQKAGQEFMDGEGQ